ncbi:MAG: hypothetical protein IT349_09155 [Candidatus Eisenbacteria bacterium]|nr:hypothetical protein [Candidatus Eisenbacteria bacterium]
MSQAEDPDEAIYVSAEKRRSVAPKLAEYAGLTDDVVAYGTHVLAWAHTATSGRPQNVLPALMFFRRGLEIADGISALIRECAPDAARPLLRVQLEALLQFRYLTQEDNERRGRAFRYFELLGRMRQLDTVDPGTEAGKKFWTSVPGDGLLGRVRLRGDETFSEQRVELQQALEAPAYVEVRAEVRRLREARQPRRRWYSLFGGPGNMEQLAARVGYAATYAEFYREWSESIHAQDSQRQGLAQEGERRFLRHIRNPEAALPTTVKTISLTLKLLCDGCRFYAPERAPEFVAWYRSVVDSRVRSVVQEWPGITVIHEFGT